MHSSSHCGTPLCLQIGERSLSSPTTRRSLNQTGMQCCQTVSVTLVHACGSCCAARERSCSCLNHSFLLCTTMHVHAPSCVTSCLCFDVHKESVAELGSALARACHTDTTARPLHNSMVAIGPAWLVVEVHLRTLHQKRYPRNNIYAFRL